MSDTLEQAMLESELALADETLITPVNEYLLIDPETRLIEVPESESLFGVYSENDVEVKHFECPKIVLNNIDLSQMYIFINYVSASGRYGQTLAKNIKTSEDGNYITFDWELTGNVFDKNTNGKIYFAVMAKKQIEDKEPVFATRKASGDYYETIEAGEVIQEQHADIILEMLTRIEALEKGGTGGSYFSGKASDVSYDDTKTKLGVDNVQDAIGKVSEEIVGLKNNGTSGTGWTTEQIEILDSIGDHINFLDTEGGRLWDALIAALTNNQGTTKVLTSITAVYSGGSVEAGTQTSDLKITVTATYDDGTSKTVIGYTTSPSTILEGENTVTVTYNGKTSTFDVVGIVTPAEVTLESISAVFNGENAQAGTNASDLDITVTGHYSDGSMKTETEWTTAGIVSEGENVFTIYLDDKTCTVSVVGVAVEEDVEVGAGTKIARFEGQTSENGYGTATIDSTLIENNKIYAFVLDKNTTVSAYNRIILFGFFLKTINGTLKIMAPSYNFDGASCNISESEGVITFGGTNMNKFHKGTFYDLYEVGNDDQVVTDGQLFDYIGTIEPTKNDGFENTLTIPASAFTEDSYFAVVLRTYNTEYDYITNVNSYGRVPNVFWGYHGSKWQRVLANGQHGSLFDITKNDDGTLTIVGESAQRFYSECNLVYDVYRAKPIWG